MRPVRSIPHARKAAAVAAIITVAAASPTTATGGTAGGRSSHASVTGAGEFRLPYLDDADIRSFTFDAHAAPYSRPLPGVPTGLPTDAYGTVTVSHYSAERDVTYTAEGTLTSSPS